MCSRAILTQSHFRVMEDRFSLGWVMSQYYYPPTSGRRLWTPLAFSHTLDGFSLRLEKVISCLCHLMHCCPTPLIFSPFHTPVLPLLISLGLTLAPSGTIVIGVRRPLLLSCYLYIRTTCICFSYF